MHHDRPSKVRGLWLCAVAAGLLCTTGLASLGTSAGSPDRPSATSPSLSVPAAPFTAAKVNSGAKPLLQFRESAVAPRAGGKSSPHFMYALRWTGGAAALLALLGGLIAGRPGSRKP